MTRRTHRNLLHAISLTKKRGVPPPRMNGLGGRQWYQGYGDDPTGSGYPPPPDLYQDPSAPQAPQYAPPYIDPAYAPPNSGLLPASRADLLATDFTVDPVGQAQSVVADVLNATPYTPVMGAFRPAVGGALLFAKGVPPVVRWAGVIWGLWPLWCAIRNPNG